MRAGMQNRVGAVAIATLLACVLQAQVPGETLTWHPGARSVRQVSVSTPDSVPVRLLAGQFVRVEVMQTGIDVAVTFRSGGAAPV